MSVEVYRVAVEQLFDVPCRRTLRGSLAPPDYGVRSIFCGTTLVNRRSPRASRFNSKYLMRMTMPVIGPMHAALEAPHAVCIQLPDYLHKLVLHVATQRMHFHH